MKLGMIAIGELIALAELQLTGLLENSKEEFEIRISLFQWQLSLARSFSEMCFRGLERSFKV